LRRAALGVIRLIVENELRLPLLKNFRLSDRLIAGFDSGISRNCDTVDLLSFFADRLKVHLREKGVRHDLISAVFALGTEDDLVRLLARVNALGVFLETDDGANLLTAYKRAANILRIEKKKDGASYEEPPDANLLEQDEEKALYGALKQITSEISPFLKEERFSCAMQLLAGLRPSVDAFFDEVTVNCEDQALRVNRLKLLSRIWAAMNMIADFSKIVGGER